MPRFLLFWAAAPAVVLSVWLLQLAEAPRSMQTLQVVMASVAAAVFVVLVSMRRVRPTGDVRWFALALALWLFIPLLADSRDGPERWLVLGSVRLYVAPIVLPLLLLLIGAPLRVPAIYAASVAIAATALALQPDASQLSAFALAMLVLLPAPSAHLLLRWALLAVLLCCAVVAWRTPDQLAPVRYVEGVFNLAAEISPFALVAALISAALPVMAFAWVARLTGSRGTFAVAVYYTSLFALSPLQVTPAPLLGFGAGPILGYFLVAGAISRESGNDAA
jgi:hypothetical protein